MQRSVLILLSLSACVFAAPQTGGRGRAIPLQGDHQYARILKATQQQTVDGSYGFAYVADNGQTRNEVSNNGVVEGSYSYVDADGVERKVKYTAGPEGFQVEADHIPKPQQPAGPAPPRSAAPAPRPQPAPFVPRAQPAPFVPRAQPPPAPRPQQQFAPSINAFPQDFKNARPIGGDARPAPTPRPSPIEEAQLAEQQRLLQQNIARHEQFIADVASGKHRPAPSAAAQRPQSFSPQQEFSARPQFSATPQAPRFSPQPQQFSAPQAPQFIPQQQLGVQDFRSLQIPAQQLVGQPGSFRAPAATSPFQLPAQPSFQSAPRFSGAPSGASSFQQFRPAIQAAQAAQAQQQAPRAPFQFAQQPGVGFNFVVQN